MPRASPLSSKLLPLALSLGASMLLHGAVVQVWSSWQAGAVTVNPAGVSVWIADERLGHLESVAKLALPAATKIPDRVAHTTSPHDKKSLAPAARPALVSQAASPLMEAPAPRVQATAPVQPPAPPVDERTAQTLTSAPAQQPILQPALQEPAYVMGSPQNPEPDYPFVARKFEWEGVVRIGVDVSASGHPQQVEVLQSSGHSVLDQTALETIRDRWLFKPALQNGKAVSGKVIVPVQFVLRD